MNTVSLGRTPAPHSTRACASPMRSQSPLLMAMTVGMPVVPDEPWMRRMFRQSSQMLLPNGGLSSRSCRRSSFVMMGMRRTSSSDFNWSGWKPASPQRFL